MATVLVADDEPCLRRLIRVTIEPEGHEVVEAGDGDAAWRLIHRLRPAIVVLDVCMPGPDGFELTRAIRADPALAGTRVVLVTGRALDEADERAALVAGVDHYLTKPFSPVRLLNLVEQALPADTRPLLSSPVAVH
jgi:CheY-like chemotaxis protein